MSSDFENQNNDMGNGNQQGYTDPFLKNDQQSYSGQYNNYNGQYTSYNNVPLDKNGRPLQNNFGMKLTFSILEMICCNLISLVLGIVSCVYTCKANTAYKEGRWDEFQSNAKTSAITLWIGFAGFILHLILGIIICVVAGASIAALVNEWHEEYPYFEDSNEDYYFYDDDDNADIKFYDDDDDDDIKIKIGEDTEEAGGETAVTDEEPIIPLTEPEGDGFTDPSLSFNGTTIVLPVTYDEFMTATGCTMNFEDETEELDAADYDIVSVYDDAGDEVCSIWVMNLSDVDLAMAECYVVGIIVYNDSYARPDIVIQNGITFDSTREEVMEAFGNPTSSNSSSYEGTTYETCYWHFSNPKASYFDEMEIDFMDDAIYCIEVDNSTILN